MTIADWIGLCIIFAAAVGLATWAITSCYYENSRKHKCHHDFEKVLEVDKPGVHKVAYLCKECGYVRKVEL